MKEIIIQAVGVLAYLILIYSYQKKSKIKILFMQVISAVFFALHFYLLSGLTGAICNFLNVFVLITIYIYEIKKFKRKVWLIIIITPLLLLIPFFTYENMYSLLPIFASILGISGFLCDKEDYIRITGIFSNAAWLVYGCIYKSYPSIIFETITIIAIIVAILRKRYCNKR